MIRLLPLALVACSAAPASVLPRSTADGAADAPGCTVTGTATVEATPDVADLVATVSIEAGSPREATAKARALQASLTSAFGSAGVAPADLAVSSLELDPVTDRDARVRAYRASIVVTATTRDFDALGDLMEEAAGAGATGISSRFRVADLPAIRSRARDQATVAAKAKADQLAGALGFRLGSVRSVTELAEPSWGLGNENFRIATPDDQVHGDAQPVTVSLTVTWDLVP